jgi:RNA polymerase sigma-70 factor (ECF subfamily)
LAVRNFETTESGHDSFSPRDADDIELVTAAQKSRAAFAPVYERYIDSIFRYCLRRTGHRETAEDATATVFVKALAQLGRFQIDRRSFRSWLFAIAHNVLVDLERAQRPSASDTAVPYLIDPNPGPESLALHAEADATTVRLLMALPSEQRRVLEMRLAGLRTAEIADALGITVGAVRACQYRAAKRLRPLLRPNDKNGDTDGAN